MSDRTYDAFGQRFVVPLVPAGVAIDGTNTAFAAESASTVSLPFACKLVNGSRYTVTGASEAIALASAIICKAAQGTGTLSAVGTFVFTGTNATGSVGTANVATGSTANFAAGDAVCISEAIGTVATIQTHSFSLGFEELFN